MKQERERLEMWLEKERQGSKVILRLRTEASEEEELVDTCRCIEDYSFLILSGRLIMMILFWKSSRQMIEVGRHPLRDLVYQIE